MTELDSPVEDHAVVATVVQRIGGALVDGLLTSMVVVVPLLLGILEFDDKQGRFPISPGWVAALIAFGAVYTIVPTALWGQTPGKLAVGTRVVTEAGGAVPGWRRSVIRWALSEGMARLPYIGLPAGLAVLASVLVDPRRRGLHDKAAGTIVVRAVPAVGGSG